MKVLDDCYAQSSYSAIKAPSNQLKILWTSINLGAKSFLSKYLETKSTKVREKLSVAQKSEPALRRLLHQAN